MRVQTPQEFFEGPHPRISRFNFLWDFVFSFRDLELGEANRYYVLQSKTHTQWNDFSFFNISLKDRVPRALHPITSLAQFFSVWKTFEDTDKEVQDIDDRIRDYFWRNFRITSHISTAVPLRHLGPKHLIYESPDHGTLTACQLQYYSVSLTEAEMRRVIEHPASFLFPEEELLGQETSTRFSNQVKTFFEPATYSQVRDVAEVCNVQRGRRSVDTATILFSDMKDFSQLVIGTYDPFVDDAALREFTHLCKLYQAALCRPIRMRGGEIVQTAGDAFFALFLGEPQDTAGRAFASCMDIFEAVRALQKKANLKSLKNAFETRVGLATGRVLHGFLGPYELKERTAFGKPVNLCARLESAVKDHSPGAGILLDSSTYESLDETARAKLSKVQVSVKESGSTPLECYLYKPG